MYPYRVIMIIPSDRAGELAVTLSDKGAVVEGCFPDLASYRNQWKEPPSDPRLFIVWLKRPDDANILRELNETLPGSPLLALTEGMWESGSLFQITRAGAAQIVPVPLREYDLSAALDAILRQFGRAPRIGKLIAVTSAPEGENSAAFSVNLASEIVDRWRLDCVLAEPGARLARLGMYLEVSSRGGGVQELLTKSSSPSLNDVQESLARTGGKLRLLLGPAHGISFQAAPVDRILLIINLLRQLCNVVIVDVPNTYDDVWLETLVHAEHIILLAGQNLPAIHGLKLLREALLTRKLSGVIHVVLNHFDFRLEGFEANRLRELCKLDELWTVAEDQANWQGAINNGRPIRLHSPKSPIIGDIDRIITHLLGPQHAD